MGTDKVAHRPSALKQTNKPHKTGSHRSKGAISAQTCGKTSTKAASKKLRKEQGKEVRRLQNKQLREKKREEVFARKRNLCGSLAPPILITIVPLQEDFDIKKVLSLLTECDETAYICHSPQGITHISIPRFKQRLSILVPPIGNTFATLDAIKVSTTVLFVTSVVDINNSYRSDIIDDWGREIFESSIAQGLPTSIVAVTGLETIPLKKRHEIKQQTQDIITKLIPDEKIIPLDKQTDALNLLRKAGNQKQKNIIFRTKRPYLLAEKVKYTSDNDDSNNGTLEISGYVRGMPLSVNGLIHIPGFGDYQMSQIDKLNDPYPLDKSNKSTTNDVHMKDLNDDQKVLDIADPNKQESLEMENVSDPMDAEQTWPDELDMAEAGPLKKDKKILKVVPKGTSEYQASWIPDEDGVEIEDDDDDYDDNNSQDGRMSIIEEQDEDTDDDEGDNDNDEFETMTVSEAPPDEQRYDQEIDFYEEREAIAKLKEAKLDEQYPDEIDTPQDQLAKIRFQKYRGLESFRTSPWDPKENLPFDYSRIFQFQNFDRTRRRVFKEIDNKHADDDDDKYAKHGMYITIHVKNVKQELFNAFCTLNERPLIVFGLLLNEQKMSLLNVTLKRTMTNDEPIKSKERLIFQCGFRRFSTCPVFSQHTSLKKHKYVRYFQNDDTVVASMYGQIIYPPCQVLCYKENKDGSLNLIAKGNVLSADPNRLLIKRVVLSGHPFKVNKHSAVIRFMFFNRDDINAFKPVKLRTKYGRRGHIKEPLGTHGHMKCVFDGQLKSQDTVHMNLYKRVYPKWTYEPCLLTNETTDHSTMET
ncbi:hypothetical protein HCN44_004572 [Aphidius gifuensis]|uniref:Pre-rRNA-processing protein TSR1 homolog n=1 Tax=Aphidius gifuensis TaxID=684658 RepID=A0A834XX32_APHGI|nr:pre-rRNA-processing protein TSR1 homolog [Aphidius gifuensis]KAF7995100.1 hypothetical protein HCN44_004572 [Aphidius gifuensis]